MLLIIPASVRYKIIHLFNIDSSLKISVSNSLFFYLHGFLAFFPARAFTNLIGFKSVFFNVSIPKFIIVNSNHFHYLQLHYLHIRAVYPLSDIYDYVFVFSPPLA
jgi:hypothetical protein